MYNKHISSSKIQTIKKILVYLITIGLIFLIVYLLSLKNNKLPSYSSNKSVGKQTNYTITGVEAGAGMMANAQQAIKTYGLNKKGWQLQASSTAIMLSQLNKAIKNRQPIVITGWTPHWMFVVYRLKFLKDPKKIYGNGEHEDTITRKGFKQDNPGAYKFLENFSVQMNKIPSVLRSLKGGESPQKAAKKYIKQNPTQIKQWLKNVPQGKGEKISIGRQSFTYETFITFVAERVLRNRGYKVTDKQLDPGIMWQGLVTKSLDSTITAELPVTQKIYARKYKGQYNHVKINLRGARIGLAVPKYMKNVNSINDLKK